MTETFSPWSAKPLALPSNTRPASHRTPEHFFAICRTNGQVRVRMCATIGPMRLPTKSRASTVFQSVAVSSPSGNVIAAALLGSALRATIERTQPLVALVARTFLRGRAGTLNLTGYLSRWSFRTLIKPLQKSLSVLGVLFSPSLSFAALHANNKAWSSPNDVQKKTVPGA